MQEIDHALIDAIVESFGNNESAKLKGFRFSMMSMEMFIKPQTQN